MNNAELVGLNNNIVKLVVLTLIALYFTGCGSKRDSQILESASCDTSSVTANAFSRDYILLDNCTGVTRMCSLDFDYFIDGEELHLLTRHSLVGVPIECIVAEDAECLIKDLVDGHEMVCVKEGK